MAKVLKNGLAEAWWVGRVVTCTSCASEWEVEQRDQFQRSHGRGVAVQCPICTLWNEVRMPMKGPVVAKEKIGTVKDEWGADLDVFEGDHAVRVAVPAREPTT